jgi:hypothetical protein
MLAFGGSAQLAVVGSIVNKGPYVYKPSNILIFHFRECTFNLETHNPSFYLNYFELNSQTNMLNLYDDIICELAFINKLACFF